MLDLAELREQILQNRPGNDLVARLVALRNELRVRPSVCDSDRSDVGNFQDQPRGEALLVFLLCNYWNWLFLHCNFFGLPVAGLQAQSAAFQNFEELRVAELQIHQVLLLICVFGGLRAEELENRVGFFIRFKDQLQRGAGFVRVIREDVRYCRLDRR